MNKGQTALNAVVTSLGERLGSAIVAKYEPSRLFLAGETQPAYLWDTACQTGDVLLDPIIEAHWDESKDRPFDYARLMSQLRQALGCSQIPAEVDWDRVAQTQRLFRERAIPFGLVLVGQCLPLTFCGAKGGAQALELHGEFHRGYRQRMLSTMRWIKRLMCAESEAETLAPLMDIRITHALARQRLSRHPGWKREWGSPINQEALTATVLAFSLLMADGLRRMGMALSEEERENLLYTWSVFGQIMGVQKQYLPRTVLEARSSWQSIQRRNFEASDAGKKLAQAHLDFLSEALLPFAMPRVCVESFVALLMGEEWAELLGLECRAGARMTVGSVLQLWAYAQRLQRARHDRAHVERLSMMAWQALEERWQTAA